MEQVNQAILDEIVRRIVQVAQPEKIILFGSAARGEMGPHSDVDLLVVKSGAHRRRLAQAIYMRLFGVGQAVDVVVVTPDDIERYQDSCALVIHPALREGRVVYARRTVSSSRRPVSLRPDLAQRLSLVERPGQSVRRAFQSRCPGRSTRKPSRLQRRLFAGRKV